MLNGIEVDGVLVPAENIDGVAADAQPWTRNYPLIDRVAHRRICRPRALGAISRSAVNPAIRSARAANVAIIVRCGTAGKGWSSCSSACGRATRTHRNHLRTFATKRKRSRRRSG